MDMFLDESESGVVFVRLTCVVLYICMTNCCIVHMFGWPQGR